MRVLHVDSAREDRGGQRQLALLLGDDPLVAPEGHPAFERAVETFGPWGLYRAIRRVRPDLIAAHTPRAHSLCVIQRAVPVIVHRRVDFAPRNPWKYQLPRGFVAVSAAVRDVLVRAGVPAERIRVVHDGIEPPRPMPALPRPTGTLVVAVGALVPHKGHEHLVRAAAIGGFTAWIAGEGPLRGALGDLARSLGADVTLLGARSDVPALLATADVFVHPSVEEGLGQVVLEARALGCRTVASRAGGVPEAVGPAAILVPPGDPRALAHAVSRSAAGPRPAPELPAPFTAEAMRSATRAAYAELLGG